MKVQQFVLIANWYIIFFSFCHFLSYLSSFSPNEEQRNSPKICNELSLFAIYVKSNKLKKTFISLLVNSTFEATLLDKYGGSLENALLGIRCISLLILIDNIVLFLPVRSTKSRWAKLRKLTRLERGQSWYNRGDIKSGIWEILLKWACKQNL